MSSFEVSSQFLYGLNATNARTKFLSEPSTYLPVTSSAQDLETHMGVTGLSSAAVGAANKNLPMVTADRNDKTGGSEFSIPLPYGFFLG